jgi:hypothetical protein
MLASAEPVMCEPSVADVMLIAPLCLQVCYDGVAAWVPRSAGAICSSSSQHPEPEHIRWDTSSAQCGRLSANGVCTQHESAATDVSDQQCTQPECMQCAAGASSIAQHAALTALALGTGGGQPVQQMVAAFQVQQAILRFLL